jgi:acetate kinase
VSNAVLVLNAGSSSIKFAIYDIDKSRQPVTSVRGMLEVTKSPGLVAMSPDGKLRVDRPLRAEGVATGIEALLDWFEEEFGARQLIACGHRIVHGGTVFYDPVPLTPQVVDGIESLTPLAPLHQPRSIAPIHAMTKLRPQLPQVGCFDTAFHRTIKPPASRFALPRSYEERGIRRFGFHGLSYEYIAACLRREGKADRRTVVAHLGNGASLCAMQNGRSVDTTMGFSALDGLVMGTRCGTIDPGVLLYLLEHDGMTPPQLRDLLYQRSGLLGVSGLSSDMRDLEASGDAQSREAIELFVFRVARDVAALASTMAGLESLIFTAGIGEHSSAVRKAICERLSWMGIVLDEEANSHHAAVLNATASSVDVRIISADEEIVVAQHVLKAIEPVTQILSSRKAERDNG